MHDTTKQIIEVIQNIPRGKVLSYAEVARRAGLPNGARQVSRVLHSSSRKHDLPWHRVINSQGKISLTGNAHDLQRSLLESEGIKFDSRNRIDLEIYQY